MFRVHIWLPFGFPWIIPTFQSHVLCILACMPSSSSSHILSNLLHACTALQYNISYSEKYEYVSWILINPSKCFFWFWFFDRQKGMVFYVFLSPSHNLVWICLTQFFLESSLISYMQVSKDEKSYIYSPSPRYDLLVVPWSLMKYY